MLTRLFRPAYRRWVFRRKRQLRRNALTGSPAWRLVAIGFYSQNFVRKQLRKTPDHLTTDRVLIGQALAVAAIAPSTRKQKRQARKAAGRQ